MPQMEEDHSMQNAASNIGNMLLMRRKPLTFPSPNKTLIHEAGHAQSPINPAIMPKFIL
jgi:hypothetical protein